jgi:hypothetical protein
MQRYKPVKRTLFVIFLVPDQLGFNLSSISPNSNNTNYLSSKTNVILFIKS